MLFYNNTAEIHCNSSWLMSHIWNASGSVQEAGVLRPQIRLQQSSGESKLMPEEGLVTQQVWRDKRPGLYLGNAHPWEVREARVSDRLIKLEGEWKENVLLQNSRQGWFQKESEQMLLKVARKAHTKSQRIGEVFTLHLSKWFDFRIVCTSVFLSLSRMEFFGN